VACPGRRDMVGGVGHDLYLGKDEDNAGNNETDLLS
jgi:hypothetical protein